MRPNCRAGIRRDVPRGGRHPGRVPPVAPSGQFAGARATRPGPGRELRRDRDAGPRQGTAGLGRAADPAHGSRVGRALIGAAGAGLVGAAVFTTDPVSGYPPGTPDALTQPSPTGMIHNLAAVPVFFGLPAAAFTCGRQSVPTGHRGFGLYCAATATTMLAATALASAGFNQSPRLVNLAGLFQRARHHDRLRLAHGPVRTRAHARACRRSARKPSTRIGRSGLPPRT